MGLWICKRVAVGATGWMGAVRERCQHWGKSSLEVERDEGLVIPFDHLDPAIPEGSTLKFSICGLLSLTYRLVSHNERRTETIYDFSVPRAWQNVDGQLVIVLS